MTHIIIDEVHEREMYSDFLLNVMRDILPLRPYLRLVLMTADPEPTELQVCVGVCVCLCALCVCVFVYVCVRSMIMCTALFTYVFK